MKNIFKNKWFWIVLVILVILAIILLIIFSPMVCRTACSDAPVGMYGECITQCTPILEWFVGLFG